MNTTLNNKQETSTRRPKLSISDFTGSRRWNLSPGPEHETVGEFLATFVEEVGLPERDSTGRPTTYSLRSERLGARLNISAPISELEEGDPLTITPSVQAGAPLGENRKFPL